MTPPILWINTVLEETWKTFIHKSEWKFSLLQSWHKCVHPQERHEQRINGKYEGQKVGYKRVWTKKFLVVRVGHGCLKADPYFSFPQMLPPFTENCRKVVWDRFQGRYSWYTKMSSVGVRDLLRRGWVMAFICPRHRRLLTNVSSFILSIILQSLVYAALAKVLTQPLQATMQTGPY